MKLIEIKDTNRNGTVWINPRNITSIETGEQAEWGYNKKMTIINLCDRKFVVVAEYPDEVIEKINNFMENA